MNKSYANVSSDVSIVVPALNESGNMAGLVERIDASMHAAGLTYEVVIIDDHSTDGTFEVAATLGESFPVVVQKKVGRRGKAYSIIEGVNTAKSDIICMIDADLQYPPEDIALMVNMMIDNHADVVLSNRLTHETSYLRRLASRVYNLIFTRLMFGIDYDTQSGLKVFRKRVMADMDLNPSPWSFDLEFILQCLMNDCKILTHDIVFGRRFSGEPKLKVAKVTFELSKASIQMRLKISRRKIRAAYEQNLRHDMNAARAGS